MPTLECRPYQRADRRIVANGYSLTSEDSQIPTMTIRQEKRAQCCDKVKVRFHKQASLGKAYNIEYLPVSEEAMARCCGFLVDTASTGSYMRKIQCSKLVAIAPGPLVSIEVPDVVAAVGERKPPE